MSMFASGTPGDPEDDGSAFEAPGTSEDHRDDGSDDDGAVDPEALQAENARLRNAHAQLLSEKTTFERTRAENEQLRSLLVDMNRQRKIAPEPEPEDDVDWDATLAELRRSDDPRDKVTLELTRELYRTKKQLTDLTNKAETGKDIPAADMAEVEELMKTGDYRTYRAAYKAVLGDRLVKLPEKTRTKDDPDPKQRLRPTPSGASDGRPQVKTVVKSVARDKVGERKVIKASEYRGFLQSPEASEWRKKRLSGAITVVPG